MNKQQRKLELAIDRRISHIDNVKAYRAAEKKMLYALAELNHCLDANEANEWLILLEQTSDLLKKQMIVIDKKF
jgi:hypothetical protein